VLAGGLLVASYPAMQAGNQVLAAVIIGAVLSTANVLVGFLAIEYSFEKSHATFLKAVLGGMGIRIVVMLALLVLLIRYAGLPVVALVVSVLGFYVIFLVLELLYIQRKVSHKYQSSP
jgi:hypothetical protein